MSEMKLEDFKNKEEFKEYKRMNKNFSTGIISRSIIINCFYEDGNEDDEMYENVKFFIGRAKDKEMMGIAKKIGKFNEETNDLPWWMHIKTVVEKHLMSCLVDKKTMNQIRKSSE